MRAGASKPWRETLADAIGIDKLDASPILEYFELLDGYLSEQLELANETVGWRSTFEKLYKDDSADSKVYVGVGLTAAALLLFLVAAVCHFKNKRSINTAIEQRNLGSPEEKSIMLDEMFYVGS